MLPKVTFLHRKHSERGKSYFSPLICMRGFTAWITWVQNSQMREKPGSLYTGDTAYKMGTVTVVGPPGALWEQLLMCLHLCRWIWLKKTAMLAGLTLNQWPYALVSVTTSDHSSEGPWSCPADNTVTSSPLLSLLISFEDYLRILSSLKPSTPSPPLHLASYFIEKKQKK